MFKLSATGSMKMVMLVDLKGAVTDCNLLAQTALNRALSSQILGFQTSLMHSFDVRTAPQQ